MIVVKPSVAILAITQSAAKLIERAGRVCWKSEDKITPDSSKTFCDRVVRGFGHESIAEHASATVHWVTDRIVANQLVRHRIAAYSQESTHYLNYTKGRHDRQIRVCRPWDLEERTTADVVWRQAMEDSERAYFQLVEECGLKHYEARYVLPLGLKTELVATYNFRTWAHVVKQRTKLREDGKPVNTPETHHLMRATAAKLMLACPEFFEPSTLGMSEGDMDFELPQ
jgi:thymidylate synthase (FAD)